VFQKDAHQADVRFPAVPLVAIATGLATRAWFFSVSDLSNHYASEIL
jgi:hypothetical protein